MNKLKSILKYFSPFEWSLWLGSLAVITIVSIFNPQRDLLTTLTSLVGATGLIFISKGNVIGQMITILFSLMYGYISFNTKLYGEMITYVGMSMPISIISVVTWLRNPASKNEVKVAPTTAKKLIILSVLCVIVTGAFYFILKYFNTDILIVSTISVATSFMGASLTAIRSKYYAIGYMCNDIILMILWFIKCFENIGFLTMLICITVFLINDSYALFNWQRIQKRQAAKENK